MFNMGDSGLSSVYFGLESLVLMLGRAYDWLQRCELHARLITFIFLYPFLIDLDLDSWTFRALNFRLVVFAKIWFNGGADCVMFPVDAFIGKRREGALLFAPMVRLRRFLNYCSVILYFCGFRWQHRRAHCLLCWEGGERGYWLLRR